MQCFNRYNLWTGTGQFTLALGMEASAFVADLSVAPAAGTAAGTVVAATPATGAPGRGSLATPGRPDPDDEGPSHPGSTAVHRDGDDDHAAARTA